MLHVFHFQKIYIVQCHVRPSTVYFILRVSHQHFGPVNIDLSVYNFDHYTVASLVCSSSNSRN
jgi:hypothetical protein